MKSIQRNQSNVEELNLGYVSQNKTSRPTVYFLGPLQFSDLKYKYFVNTILSRHILYYTCCYLLTSSIYILMDLWNTN